MCARYYIDDDLYEVVHSIAGKADEKIRICGDVHPSEKAPVIVSEKKMPKWKSIAWGYPKYGGKGLVINARSETIEEKWMFQNGIHRFRCLIPASGFYEWDANKERVTFCHKDQRIMFLAGCYDYFEEEPRFTIITTAANTTIQPVHDRMPVIVETADIKSWLFTDRYMDILQKDMPELKARKEYEQMTLF